MAWVQVGSVKINTANVCYIENREESVLVHFHGQWSGNPLELKAAEAKNFWRHVKGEDAMYSKDKGSAFVLPKKISAAPMPVVLEAGDKGAEKPKPASPAPVGATASSQLHRPQSSHSHHHSSSHSQPHSSSSHSKPVAQPPKV
jgi:hypothetical protein